MPNMDGFDATQLIRALESRTSSKDGTDMGTPFAERKKAYIVALTGLASRKDRDKADSIGFDEYLTKPYSLATIGKVLEKLAGEG